jgi:hypothetical protein
LRHEKKNEERGRDGESTQPPGAKGLASDALAAEEGAMNFSLAAGLVYLGPGLGAPRYL